MYGTGTKKMLMMMILEVLKKYSDADHHLSQQMIMRYLKSEYDMSCDRRSVRANVEALTEMGYDITTEGGYALLSRDFDDPELRMLIDSVLFSRNITSKQADRLIKKLQGFGNTYFESKVSHVASCAELSRLRTDNTQVMITVNVLNDAIDAKKKVMFHYGAYGTDFKLHPRKKDSKIRTYIVNPYQMIASNGHYYLLGNIDAYDDISYYKIDKIMGIQILDEKVKPIREVRGLEHGLDLPKHLAEHVYLFCDRSVPVKLKCKTEAIDTLVDWFGRDFKIIAEKDDEITVSLKCSENAMLYWALQYGLMVEIIEPAGLRGRIRDTIKEMSRKYMV